MAISLPPKTQTLVAQTKLLAAPRAGLEEGRCKLAPRGRSPHHQSASKSRLARVLSRRYPESQESGWFEGKATGKPIYFGVEPKGPVF